MQPANQSPNKTTTPHDADRQVADAADVAESVEAHPRPPRRRIGGIVFLVLALLALVFTGLTLWSAFHPESANKLTSANTIEITTNGPAKFAIKNYGFGPLHYKPLGSFNVSLELQESFDFNIPAGDLNEQAEKFYELLQFPASHLLQDLQGKRGNAVKGRYSVREALDIWLKGTGCQHRIVNEDMLNVHCSFYQVLRDYELQGKAQDG